MPANPPAAIGIRQVNTRPDLPNAPWIGVSLALSGAMRGRGVKRATEAVHAALA